MGSPNSEDPLLPSSTMPEQKSLRLAKKGGDLPFPKAGFRRFSPDIPFPPRLFAETKREVLDSFLPALFVFGACFFARATRKRVLTTTQIGDESFKITFPPQSAEGTQRNKYRNQKNRLDEFFKETPFPKGSRLCGGTPKPPRRKTGGCWKNRRSTGPGSQWPPATRKPPRISNSLRCTR